MTWVMTKMRRRGEGGGEEEGGRGGRGGKTHTIDDLRMM